MAVAAFVLGLVAFLICWVPLVGFISIPLALLGVVLGGVGLARGGASGFAGAGTVVSFLALAVSLVYILAISDALNEVERAFSSTSPTRTSKAPSKAKQKPRVFQMGQSFQVGYTSYVVHRTKWMSQIRHGRTLVTRPNAAFLTIEVTVRNEDRKARMVPPFHLIDAYGNEFSIDAAGSMIDGGLGIIETLNPGVQKTGWLVFDVPKNKKYLLKVSGGYWSTADGYVRLSH